MITLADEDDFKSDFTVVFRDERWKKKLE